MLGLIIMCVPLGIAVGLSAVAIIHTEPDGPAGCVEEDALARRLRDPR